MGWSARLVARVVEGGGGRGEGLSPVAVVASRVIVITSANNIQAVIKDIRSRARRGVWALDSGGGAGGLPCLSQPAGEKNEK